MKIVPDWLIGLKEKIIFDVYKININDIIIDINDIIIDINSLSLISSISLYRHADLSSDFD